MKTIISELRKEFTVLETFELKPNFTYLGNKLNVDIYLAAIVVFVGRMFINLTIIRKYYIDKWSKKIKEYKTRKANKIQEEQK